MLIPTGAVSTSFNEFCHGKCLRTANLWSSLNCQSSPTVNSRTYGNLRETLTGLLGELRLGHFHHIQPIARSLGALYSDTKYASVANDNRSLGELQDAKIHWICALIMRECKILVYMESTVRYKSKFLSF